MRITRLYSNKPEIFAPIEFRQGLSAVLAEIRLPQNRNLDTHNLGKTTVGELLDFCLLKGKSNSFFLFRHQDLFDDFVFYLEVSLPSGGFLTIARAVNPGSRASMLRSESEVVDAREVAAEGWDHTNLPFGRAKLLLDGYLGIEALKPWPFRKLVGYLIRSQRDYLDVFQLGKFSGKHQDWKPFVAHLVGMDSEPVLNLYNKREEVVKAQAHLSSLVREWGADATDPSVIDGLIALKRRDLDRKTEVFESFSFSEEDASRVREMVDQTEAGIAALNEESYRLTQLLGRLDESLAEHRVVFRTEDAESLFAEAGIAFGKQIRRDYSQLVAFNRAISEERRAVLEEQRRETQERLGELSDTLGRLNAERARSLEFLRETDSLQKYRELSRELASLQAELSTLEARRDAAARVLELRRDVRSLEEEVSHLQDAVESQIVDISRDEKSLFAQLRRYFTEIIYEVLGQDAVLAIRLNNEGGIEFIAEFIDEAGTATSGDRGTSYRKLLCIAFDLAMLRTRLDVPFPRFVFHDGALEQLEPRKREKLLGVFRDYAALGVQPIISLLDSDLPAPLGTTTGTLREEEVVLTLHDEGQDGRLFKMASW